MALTANMPPDDRHAAALLDTCEVCGDGTERGQELCAAHLKEHSEPKPLAARTDNWTASMARRPMRRRR